MPHAPSPTIRHPLKEARERAGMTLRGAGAVTLIDFRRLHLLEQGLRPKAIEIQLLAAAYHVKPSRLREVLGDAGVLVGSE